MSSQERFHGLGPVVERLSEGSSSVVAGLDDLPKGNGFAS
jgi:hypothetical protein